VVPVLTILKMSMFVNTARAQALLQKHADLDQVLFSSSKELALTAMVKAKRFTQLAMFARENAR
jgi:hypothetical protein